MAVERVIIEIVGDATKINDTISQLEKLGKVDKANADSFRKNNQQTQNAIKQTSNSLNDLNNQFENIGKAIAGAFAFQKLVEFGKESVQTAAKLDSIGKSLEYITGSSKTASATMEFLRKLSNKLGLEFISTASAFKQFAGSAVQSGMSLNQTKSIFEQVSKAVVTMGLSADDAQGVFLALSQIMSKGTVQAEELRGQIGERIPGAFAIAAKSIGVTEQKLNKMLEQGQVLSKDFIPKFAKQLEKDLGGGAENAATSIQASLNIISNAFDSFKISVGNSLKPVVAEIANLARGLEVLSGLGYSIFNPLNTNVEKFRDKLDRLPDNNLLDELLTKIETINTRKGLTRLKADIEDAYKAATNTPQKKMLKELSDAIDKQWNSVFKLTTETDKNSQSTEENTKKKEKQLTAYEKLVKAASDLEAAMRDTLALNGIVSPKAIQQLDELKFKIQSIELAMKNLNDPALKNAGGQKMGITSELPDQLPTGDFGAAAEKKQYDELLQLHQEFIDELEVQDKGYSENYLDELKRRQEAEKENMEIVIGGLYEVLGNAVNTYFQATSQTSQMVLDNQLENIKDLYDNQIYSEQQYEQKKKELLNKDAERQHEMALFQGATQAALGILYAMQGDPWTLAARVAVAAAIGAANVALIAAQPVPQFAEGTERVTGGVKGKDSVHALLMPDEAVIKANENMSYPGLSKAWNDGNLEGFIYKNWVLPELIMHKSNEGLIQQSFADNVAKSIQLNQDFGAIENKLKRIEQAEKEGAIFIANEVKSAIKTNYRNRY